MPNSQHVHLQMPGSSFSLGYQLEGLARVAADLRAERSRALVSRRQALGHVRRAIGAALLQLGASPVASPARAGAAR